MLPYDLRVQQEVVVVYTPASAAHSSSDIVVLGIVRYVKVFWKVAQGRSTSNQGSGLRALPPRGAWLFTLMPPPLRPVLKVTSPSCNKFVAFLILASKSENIPKTMLRRSVEIELSVCVGLDEEMYVCLCVCVYVCVCMYVCMYVCNG
jgi:hypothetical protein